MFSEPAIGEAFFGRADILELLNKRVSALREGYRQNVALTGQSLAGKSSIIHHFLYTIKEEGVIPVYVEVVKEPFRAFANKFIATLLYNALTKLGQEADIYLADLLEKGRGAIPKTCTAIKHLTALIEREQFEEAYGVLLGLTSVLKEETRLPCVVILDEFDNLEYLGVKNPFLSFGKVIMVQKDTMYIVSSSRGQAIKKILSEKLSLLFGNFEIVKISDFSFKTAGEFIDTRLSGYDIDDAMRTYLTAFSNGNAFYLDKMLMRAKAIAEERLSNHIDIEVVLDTILDLVYNSNGVIHQYLLNFILDLVDAKYKETYLSILVAIANGQNKQPDISRHLRTKQGEMAKHLARLSELGFLSKHGTFYRIDDIMLEFWLKFVYQRRRSLLVDGAIDKKVIFKEDMRSYIMSFLQDLDRDAVSKISDLFNRFSNELVSIDSKAIRLPHFTKVEARSFPSGRAFIAASLRGRFWIVQIYEDYLSENEIVDYIRNVKQLGYKVSNKVIAPLHGIDENAKLLAKELKITIWDISTINMLLALYGKNRIIKP